jgi:hypothetical protein
MTYEPEIKCATFNREMQAAIPPDIRAKMNADRAAAQAAKPQRDKAWWLAESPTIPGYYLRAKSRRHGKLGELEELGTSDPYEAATFATRVGCEHYIHDNPHPAWVPVEHLFCANAEITNAPRAQK